MSNMSDDAWMEAAKDTLMNIAAVSGVAVCDLRPAQTLVADLGLDDNGLAILAEYQARIAGRLACDTALPAADGEACRDDMVWQVFCRALRGCNGAPSSADAATALLAQALGALRASGAASGRAPD